MDGMRGDQTGTTGSGAPLAVGTEVVVSPIELVAGGDALVRVDGLPLFVRNLYPGDRARVRIVEARKGFVRGEVVELLGRSESRRAVPCPVAEECGGCDWTELRLDRQLIAKKRIVEESLRRTGKLEPNAIPPIAIHPSALNYRSRSRLHIDPKTREVGFFALRTNRVVPLPGECEVVGPLALAHLDRIRAVAADVSDATEVHIWELGPELVVRTDADEIPRRLETGVRGYRFALSTSTFFQVNRHLLGTLTDLVVGHASRSRRRDTAVDLYAGVGFFTVPLASRFRRVIGVEASPDGHALAVENARELRNVETVGMPVERYTDRMPKGDFILLDPPRAGAAREVIDAVAERARERICYLSCDPVTFSRDAGRLTALVWRLASLHLVDLFPNTHHIETFSSFERVP
jgi:tRNA/tmRNA/rRNA uracil-C5-methylase (TrmA/RlmC/RlmD family)